MAAESVVVMVKAVRRKGCSLSLSTANLMLPLGVIQTAQECGNKSQLATTDWIAGQRGRPFIEQDIQCCNVSRRAHLPMQSLHYLRSKQFEGLKWSRYSLRGCRIIIAPEVAVCRYGCLLSRRRYTTRETGLLTKPDVNRRRGLAQNTKAGRFMQVGPGLWKLVSRYSAADIGRRCCPFCSPTWRSGYSGRAPLKITVSPHLMCPSMIMNILSGL